MNISVIHISWLYCILQTVFLDIPSNWRDNNGAYNISSFRTAKNLQMIYVTMFAGEGRITSNNWQIRDRKSGEHHEFKETYGMFNAGVSDNKDHPLDSSRFDRCGKNYQDGFLKDCKDASDNEDNVNLQSIIKIVSISLVNKYYF